MIPPAGPGLLAGGTFATDRSRPCHTGCGRGAAVVVLAAEWSREVCWPCSRSHVFQAATIDGPDPLEGL